MESKEKIFEETQMTVTIKFCDRNIHDVVSTTQYTMEHDMPVYAEIKKQATKLAVDINGLQYDSDSYAGCLAEVIFKYYLKRTNKEFSHPGYITHGMNTYDRGDFQIQQNGRTIVFDIKSSAKYKNVSYSKRTDVEIDYLIGTHIEYNDTEVTLYVYGTLATKDAWKYDIKGYRKYDVIPPSAFVPLKK